MSDEPFAREGMGPDDAVGRFIQRRGRFARGHGRHFGAHMLGEIDKG